MPIAGADLTELSGLVTRLAGQDRQALTAALDKMNAVVQDSATWWIGEYADRFRRDFAGFVTTTHRGLDQMLLQAALVTRQNLGAIASATGDGPWQQGPASGRQLVLAAVPGQPGFAAPAGSAFAADSGTELVKDGLELAPATYAGFYSSMQAWFRSTTVLWRSPEVLHVRRLRGRRHRQDLLQAHQP